jgi:hypothetical protein|tara:strand:+ start:3904 stop:4242 length:339 start_codon:yes stop_codon:yes gene_type:complete
MANKTYKMIVPKAGAANELGTDTMLYAVDEIYEAKEGYQKDLMEVFVANGHAMEVKVEAIAEEEGEPVRARNEKGQLKGDDPDTPDVNEAWEGGEAPEVKTKKKRTTKKKAS